MTSVRRGLIAGAVGTVVLDLVTYADMALRGRPASEVPAQLVDAVAASLGTQVHGEERHEALGALAGIATGVGVGVVVSVARRHGVRLSGLTGPVVTGALAMAASDLPVALLGVSDPREWSSSDWASDALPHLAYGTATHLTLRSWEKRAEETPAGRPSAGLVVRSFLLGAATGCRSSLGLVGAALSSGGRLARAGAGAALVGELVADKLPVAPARTEPPGLVSRFGAAAIGAGAMAAADEVTVDLPVAAAAVGAWVGTTAGLAWREAAADRMSDWQAAAIEDVVAVGLAVLVSRRRGRPAR
ncbi:hypothetical protein D9V37_18370 [Nocardioides mangrovicus]|uniref:DUF4126 family protein n=1 Tax=Nocardioides mangrovicus TaxID=2478913 RepID=A0A3L8NZG5_9ACTN|nr:hypothetical protein [Nocardioides mangrovicus]RLV48057.1 hypothetical protein D9V37_18370 [Nocardioides mangrovicus]